MPTIEICFNCLELTSLTPRNNRKDDNSDRDIWKLRNCSPPPPQHFGGRGGQLENGARARRKIFRFDSQRKEKTVSTTSISLDIVKNKSCIKYIHQSVSFFTQNLRVNTQHLLISLSQYRLGKNVLFHPVIFLPTVIELYFISPSRDLYKDYGILSPSGNTVKELLF